MPETSPWIAFRTAQPSAELRIFCFPHAGGGASLYRDWQKPLGSWIEVCPMQLPGHESRLREPLLQSMDQVAESAAEAMDGMLDRPFAFFGHSLGALVAYETALRLRDAHGVEPVHLFASARRAPSIVADEPLHALDPESFRKRLRELDGTPEEVLAHPELMELVEPILRADFRINETYLSLRDLDAVKPLSCPVTVLNGEEDHEIGPRANLEAWEKTTEGPFTIRDFPGGHFYLNAQTDEIFRILTENLKS